MNSIFMCVFVCARVGGRAGVVTVVIVGVG